MTKQDKKNRTKQEKGKEDKIKEYKTNIKRKKLDKQKQI